MGQPWEDVALDLQEIGNGLPRANLADIYSEIRPKYGQHHWEGRVTMDWQRVRKQVPKARDATDAQAFSTEPVDRDAVVRGVERIYKGFGKDKPAPIVFFDSPLQALLATAMVSGKLLYSARIVYHDDMRWGSNTWGTPSAWSRMKLPYDRQNVQVFQHLTTNPRRVLNEALFEAALQDHRSGETILASGSGEETYARKAFLALQAQLPKDHPYLKLKTHGEQTFRSRLNRMSGGQLDVGELGVYSLAFALGMKFSSTSKGIIETLRGLLDLTSAGPWWAYENAFFVSDRFLEVRRREGLPHSPEWIETPAYLFRDGWAVYAREGMLLPRQIIDDPSTLTVRRIRNERNTELRRVLIEYMGYERFMQESRAQLRSTDEYGKLWTIPNESFRVVEVKNSTPEPDGSIHRYFLRVPQHVTTPHQAVAWTFNLQADEYKPVKQT